MKSMILMISMPLACLGAGYAAGMYLVPAQETRVAAAAPATLSDAPSGQPGDHAALGIPPAPVDPDAAPSAHEAAGMAVTGTNILEIGRLTVPVLKTRSITYVVADIALAMSETAQVAKVEKSPEALLRMRDAVLASLTESAGTPAMSGVAIDTETLSARLLADLKAIGMPVEEVLFPNLFKQDVARRDIPQPAPAAAASAARADTPQPATH